ncbi:MAG: prepilin-type N-terminal cleavage/methylation domain-containing protein [Bacillota bacterium]|nr:prepilin-type N-terminal cleavage/methylation domain-containing protein [Bacillota bacterium]
MKKGFTLIELLTVMAVISILYGISYVNISSYKKIENKIDYENTNNLILSFMNNSKLKCKSMKRLGYITFDLNKHKLYFQTDINVIDVFSFPPGFKIYSITLPGKKLNINSLGYSYNAGTLKYTDREGTIHIISMTVGQDYAEIKE